jgi:cellulose synthase (UDP-forming)
MLWFFPQGVHPYNYLAMLPSLAATVFVFPMLTKGWRPTIYRVCLINSCCHLYAIWCALHGRVAEWVPTGVSAGKDRVPMMVSRILRTWILAEQTLLWVPLLLRIHEFGWRPYWATVAVVSLQLYMVAPLMTRDMGIGRDDDAERHQPATGATAAESI